VELQLNVSTFHHPLPIRKVAIADLLYSLDITWQKSVQLLITTYQKLQAKFICR